MRKTTLALLVAMASLSAFGSEGAFARDQIRVVGSSTVYPFTTAVAEQYGRAGGKTPVVESTGTGGGLKLFCAGVGADHPDVANASRRIKKSEYEDCSKHGVTDIVEIKIGFDGLSIAHAKGAPDFGLTKKQIFLALAKEIPDGSGKLVANPNKTWSDVDPSLPNKKIEVLGPPPTSGTRDSFVELVMEKGAEGIDALKALKKSDAKAFEKAWKSVREDGAYVEAGENDNLIVQKLSANPDALGIFGYSFVEENLNSIKAVPIDGVTPTYETIASGEYKVARPLFIYIKAQHVDIVPGLKDFVAEYVSEKALGEDGYLVAKGLIALPKDDLEASRKTAAELSKLDATGL
ncbi:MAG TPA: PstS family phosphate ABC transporter substrate-binding protein [Aestuariivirgaceae bacterium]|nr:PstS family phosphate ABC transporter substrate-binding protein [Aestuariivirgaceae bacterium]